MDLKSAVARWSFKGQAAPRLRLWRKLSSLLGNGVPILRALQEMHDRRADVSGHGHSETIALRHWIHHISSGQSLARAIDGWVTPDEAMLIGAGEQQGDMVSAFSRLDLILNARSKILKAVAAGVAYPAVLLLMLFGLLYFYSWKIVPVYLDVAGSKGGQFTGMAYSLVWLAEVVRQWLFPSVICLAVGVVIFVWSLPRWDGSLRVRLDRYIPYGIYRVMRGTSWLLGLASLVGVGKRVEDSLLLLRTPADGRWLANRSALCLAGIRRGLSLGEALEAAKTGFPDQEVIADLLIYSRLSGIDKAISMLAEDMLTTSLERIQTQSLLMRNIGFIAVASAVGWTTGGVINMNIQMGDILSGKGGRAVIYQPANFKPSHFRSAIAPGVARFQSIERQTS